MFRTAINPYDSDEAALRQRQVHLLAVHEHSCRLQCSTASLSLTHCQCGALLPGNRCDSERAAVIYIVTVRNANGAQTATVTHAACGGRDTGDGAIKKCGSSPPIHVCGTSVIVTQTSSRTHDKCAWARNSRFTHHHFEIQSMGSRRVSYFYDSTLPPPLLLALQPCAAADLLLGACLCCRSGRSRWLRRHPHHRCAKLCAGEKAHKGRLHMLTHVRGCRGTQVKWATTTTALATQ